MIHYLARETLLLCSQVSLVDFVIICICNPLSIMFEPRSARGTEWVLDGRTVFNQGRRSTVFDYLPELWDL